MGGGESERAWLNDDDTTGRYCSKTECSFGNPVFHDTSAHVKILQDVRQREVLDDHKSDCLELTAQYLAQGTMQMINFRNQVLTRHRTWLAAQL